MEKKNRHPFAENDGLSVQGNSTNKPPIVTGQAAEVLALIRAYAPILNVALKIEHGITESAARVHELREMGFNIQTRILPSITFRSRERRNVAEYSMGIPEWSRPCVIAGGENHA